ncbi:MAG: hypothetical protein ACJA2X_003069 [Halocynthiibacter sp.]|jgi:hypothetical protein
MQAMLKRADASLKRMMQTCHNTFLPKTCRSFASTGNKTLSCAQPLYTKNAVGYGNGALKWHSTPQR